MTPLAFELYVRPFGALCLLLQAWVLFNRLPWLNDQWERFGIRLSRRGASIVGVLLILGAAWWLVQWVGAVAGHPFGVEPTSRRSH